MNTEQSKNTILTSLKLMSIALCGTVIVGCQSVSAPNPIATELDQYSEFIQAPKVTVNPFAAQLSVGAQWNELMLAAIRDGTAFPTITSHQLFMVSVAMFDAYAMYTEVSEPFAMSSKLRRPIEEHTDENRQAAVSQAAYQMLSYLFPNYEAKSGNFRVYLSDLGLAPTAAVSELPEGIGYAAALAIIVKREGDDSFVEYNYQLPLFGKLNLEKYITRNEADPDSILGIYGTNFDPNRWQPLRVANGKSLDQFNNPQIDDSDSKTFQDQQFLTSHWRDVVPFAMTTSAQFRADPPPYYGSDELYTDALGVVSTNQEAYVRQFNEVIEIGQNLTDEQRVVSEFWADGPRTQSPPGHWNQIAQGIVDRDNLNLGETTQLFFALNAAMLDAGIAAWDTKRWYDYIRPVSAIRKLYRGKAVKGWAGPNRGIRDIPGEQWLPYQKLTFVTPSFPEYVSGHSVFSRAAAEVLTQFTRSGQFYDGTTKILHDINGDNVEDYFGEHIVPPGRLYFENGPKETVVLRWNTFLEAADQAGRSRIYGGIHIQDSDLRGRTMGTKIGRQSFCNAQDYFGDKTYEKLCETSNQRIFDPSEY